MQDRQVQPLDADLWFDEWEKLRQRRQQLDGGAPDAIVRKAFYLAQMAPLSLRSTLEVQTDEDTLEAYLDCGAYESAAFALVPRTAAISLNRQAPSGEFSCSVTLRDNDPPTADLDHSPTKALLGALFNAILQLKASLPLRPGAGATEAEGAQPTRH